MRPKYTLVAGLTAGTLLVAIMLTSGCSSGPGAPLPPTVTAVLVTPANGVLVVGQAGSVNVVATVVAFAATVQTVTADLSALGSPAAQPLIFSETTGSWGATVPVTPPTAGPQTVTVTATDSKGLTAQGSAVIRVAGSGGTAAPPVLTDPIVLGTPVTNFTSTLFVSVTVASGGSPIQGVTVNLLPVGGMANQALTRSARTPDLWTYSGLVVPPSAGTFSIVFTATDVLGATGTATARLIVNNPVP